MTKQEREIWLEFVENCKNQELGLWCSTQKVVVKVNEYIAELEEQLASANLETTIKGFWLGSEDARCHTQENSILMPRESTLIFTQSRQLEGKE